MSSELYSDRYDLPAGVELVVNEGQQVESGTVLARSPEPAAAADAKPAPKARRTAKKDADKEEPKAEAAVATLPVTQVIARLPGRVTIDRANRISILYEEREEREYSVPATARVRVETSQYIHAGQQLTDGPMDPQDILRIQGPEAVQLYLVEEVLDGGHSLVDRVAEEARGRGLDTVGDVGPQGRLETLGLGEGGVAVAECRVDSSVEDEPADPGREELGVRRAQLGAVGGSEVVHRLVAERGPRP